MKRETQWNTKLHTKQPLDKTTHLGHAWLANWSCDCHVIVIRLSHDLVNAHMTSCQIMWSQLRSCGLSWDPIWGGRGCQELRKWKWQKWKGFQKGFRRTEGWIRDLHVSITRSTDMIQIWTNLGPLLNSFRTNFLLSFTFPSLHTRCLFPLLQHGRLEGIVMNSL